MKAVTSAEESASTQADWTVGLITGAGSGIGRAACLKLASNTRWIREGTRAALVLTGRRAALLEETAAACKGCGRAGDNAVSTLCFPADLRDEKQARSSPILLF